MATGFRKNRVFLVGDAAHRFPPSGGYGMNSGIQDAHNLAWKLDFVLKGRAGDRLLDSYDLERRPVAESNADCSYGNTQRFLKTDKAFRGGNIDEINFWIRDTENHVHSVGQSRGFSYDEGALIPDGTAGPRCARASTNLRTGPADAFRTSGSTSRASTRRSTGSTRTSCSSSA